MKTMCARCGALKPSGEIEAHRWLHKREESRWYALEQYRVNLQVVAQSLN